MSKPSSVPLWGDTSTNITDPPSLYKSAGFATGAVAPSGVFNWFMNLVWQWLVWLNAFESTAHTWSALQTFNTGATVNSGLIVAGGISSDVIAIPSAGTNVPTTPSLASGANLTGYPELSYWKDLQGNLRIQGVVAITLAAGGHVGTVWASGTIPSAYRPAITQQFPTGCIMQDSTNVYQTAGVIVASNGALSVTTVSGNGSNASAYFYLDLTLNPHIPVGP